MAGTQKPPEEKERLLAEVLPDIEYEVRGWAEMSDLGIRVRGVGVRRGEAGSTDLLVFLAHDDVRGERVLEYPIDDRRFQHGPPRVGQDVGIAVHELSVQAVEALPLGRAP